MGIFFSWRLGGLASLLPLGCLLWVPDSHWGVPSLLPPWMCWPVVLPWCSTTWVVWAVIACYSPWACALGCCFVVFWVYFVLYRFYMILFLGGFFTYFLMIGAPIGMGVVIDHIFGWSTFFGDQCRSVLAGGRWIGLVPFLVLVTCCDRCHWYFRVLGYVLLLGNHCLFSVLAMPVLAYPYLVSSGGFPSWSCSLLFGSLPWLLLEVCFPWTVSPFFWALLVVLLVTFSFSSAFAGHLGSACSCLLDLAGCPCCCFYTCATGCFSFQFLGCACFYILAAFPWTVLVDWLLDELGSLACSRALLPLGLSLSFTLFFGLGGTLGLSGGLVMLWSPSACFSLVLTDVDGCIYIGW